MRSGAAQVLALTWVALACIHCRRNADAPILQQHLYPKVAVATPQSVASAQGSVARVERLSEAEPNDTPDRAQPVSAMALVAGTLLAANPVLETAAKDRPKLGKKAKLAARSTLVDADWYRLPAVAPAHVMQVELRNAPPCAELQIYDDAGVKMLRSARSVGGVRPAFPALGSTAGASMVRVVCNMMAARAKTALTPAIGGPYELAIFSRQVQANEEVEPNDVPRTDLAALSVGAIVQGTLSPEGDVDLFLLHTTGVEAPTAYVLSATGAPAVELELTVIDGATQKPLLKQLVGKGQGVLVPNLALGTLPPGSILQLRAHKGQAPDAPYAVSLQPWLPSGCTRQQDCLQLLPTEREPNDFVDHPWTTTWTGAAQTLTGLLTGAGDIDWHGLQIAPGGVASLVVTAPPALSLAVEVGSGPRTLQFTVAAGGRLAVPALTGGAAPITVMVRAAMAGGGAPNDVYTLALAPLDNSAWETDSGDESEGGKLWLAAAALTEVAASAQLAGGGWQRRGVLWPAGDRDVFGFDLRERQGPTGIELLCTGDGHADFMCAVQDVAGHDVVRVHVDAKSSAPARSLLLLPPGAWRVVVESKRPRPSQTPYAVTLRNAAEAAGLPLAATAAIVEPVDAARPPAAP